MKKLHLIIVLILLAISSLGIHAAEQSQTAQSDGEIRSKVVGTWVVDLQSPNGMSMKGTVTIASGDKFVTKMILTMGDRKQEMNIEGTWETKDGFLVETITKSDSKLAAVGSVTRDKIIRVDDQELVYQTEQGKTVTRRRSK